MRIPEEVLLVLLAMLAWTSGFELRFTELVNHIIDLRSREMARTGKGGLVSLEIEKPSRSPTTVEEPGSGNEDKRGGRSLTSSKPEESGSESEPESGSSTGTDTAEESEVELLKDVEEKRTVTKVPSETFENLKKLAPGDEAGHTKHTIEGGHITLGREGSGLGNEGSKTQGISTSTGGGKERTLSEEGTEELKKITILNTEKTTKSGNDLQEKRDVKGTKDAPKLEERELLKEPERRKSTASITLETNDESASESDSETTDLLRVDKSGGTPGKEITGMTSFGKPGSEDEANKTSAGGSELKEPLPNVNTGFIEEQKGLAQPIVWEGWGLGEPPGGKNETIFAESDAPEEVKGTKKVTEPVTVVGEVGDIKKTTVESDKEKKEGIEEVEATGGKDIKEDFIREVKAQCELLSKSSLLLQPVDPIKQLQAWSMENSEKAGIIRENCDGAMFISILTDFGATEAQRSAAEEIIREVYKSHPTLVTPKSPEDILTTLRREDLKESERKILQEILGRFIREDCDDKYKRMIVRFIVESKDLDSWTAQLLQSTVLRESWREILLEEGALTFIGLHLRSATDTMSIQLLRTSWDLVDVIKNAKDIPEEWLKGAKSVLENPPEGFLIQAESGTKLPLDHLMLTVLNKIGHQVPGAGLRFIEADLVSTIDKLADSVGEDTSKKAQALATAAHMLNAARTPPHLGLFRSHTVIKFIADHLIEAEREGKIHEYALANLAFLRSKVAKQRIFDNFDVSLLFRIFLLAYAKSSAGAMLWSFQLFSWHYGVESGDKLPEDILKVLASFMQDWASEESKFDPSTNSAYRPMLKLFRLAATRQSLELLPYVGGPIKLALKLLKDENFGNNLLAVRALRQLFSVWPMGKAKSPVPTEIIDHRKHYVGEFWKADIGKLIQTSHERGDKKVGAKKIRLSSLRDFDTNALFLLMQMLATVIADEHIENYKAVVDFLCHHKFITDSRRLPRSYSKKIILRLRENDITKDLVKNYECEGHNIVELASKENI